VSYENIAVDRDGAVMTVTVNRPRVLNALNHATIGELLRAVEEAGPDPSVRVVVLTGAGTKAFVAGADINELKALESADEAMRFARRGQELCARLERLPKPVIAAINGYALGGGCEIAMACDVRIAAERARIGQPEINLGLIPGFGGTQRLPRLVGRGAAKLLIFSGDHIDAREALRLGLVDVVVPDDEFEKETSAFAARLARKAPVALATAKAAVNQGIETDLDRGCEIEASLFGVSCATEDRVEGCAAFLEKRKPAFKGR